MLRSCYQPAFRTGEATAFDAELSEVPGDCLKIDRLRRFDAKSSKNIACGLPALRDAKLSKQSACMRHLSGSPRIWPMSSSQLRSSSSLMSCADLLRHRASAA